MERIINKMELKRSQSVFFFVASTGDRAIRRRTIRRIYYLSQDYSLQRC